MGLFALTTPNGSVGALPPRQILAGLGNYFVCTNPTPGTGVLYGTSAAYSATANGMFSISNNAPSGGKNIYLDYLSLFLTVPPTATTQLRFEVVQETGIRALSAGNLARTPVNVNPASGVTTVAVVNSFSAASGTVPAAVGTRSLVTIASIETNLGITGDNYVLEFGGDPVGGQGGGTAVRSTMQGRIVGSAAPVVIAPQNSAFIQCWWLTQATNGPTFEFELAWAEV